MKDCRHVPVSGRNSSIELLKLIAIALIILNHMTQSLTEQSSFIPFTDYLINNTLSTTDITSLLLAIFRMSGCLGNNIFVICSAWFLTDSKRSDKRKIIFMMINIWTISVLIFVITLFFGCDLDRDDTLRQFFPTSNAANWFMTCYILLYLIHPLLNKLIGAIDRRTHLAMAAVMVLLFSFANFFRPWFFITQIFYVNDLLIWIMLYFIVAYIKLYIRSAASDIKSSVIALIIGILGQASCVAAVNFIGLKIDFLGDKLLYFNYAGSPFIILAALSAFNIARLSSFHCRFINYMSGLSMLVYLIHENYILRLVYRPWIFVFIYDTFGYRCIILWLFVSAAAVFIAAFILAFIYRQSAERIVRIVSDRLSDILARLWRRLTTWLLRIE